MLSKNDMKELRGMMREVIQDTVPEMIASNNHVLKREIRDEMHSLIRASEAGLIRKMNEMEVRLRDEILDGVTDLVGGSLLPQIDGLDYRVARLEGANAAV